MNIISFLKNILLISLITFAKKSPRKMQQTSTPTKSDVILVAEIARDAAISNSRYHYWKEQEQRSSEERVAMTNIKAQKEIELKKIQEQAFQFKVNGFVKDGASHEAAIQLALETENRERKLREDEKLLDAQKKLFEEEKSSLAPQYFFYGSITTIGFVCVAMYLSVIKIV
jgi:hypothetical protein